MPINNTVQFSALKPKPFTPLQPTPAIQKILAGSTSIVPNTALSGAGSAVPSSLVSPNAYKPQAPAVAPQAVSPVPAPTASTPTPAPAQGFAQTNPNQVINYTTGQKANGNYAPLVPPTPEAPTAAPVQGLFPNVAGSLASVSQGVNPMTADAFSKAQGYQNELTQLKKDEATAMAAQGGPIPIGDITGRQGLIANYYGQRENAVATGLQSESALTGYGQAQQGLAQSGLAAAGGLVKPTVTGYGQTAFNPETNTFGSASNNGTNLDPQTQATQLAQQVMSGDITYDQALSSLGYAGGVGTNFLNGAIKSAGGKPVQLQAQGAGQQNILQSLPALTSANTAAEGIKNQITSFLQQNPQLNPSDLAASNAIKQWLQGQQFTDPRYQTLFNYLSEYTNTLAPILGVGGDPTNLKTEISQGFINGLASGKSIAEVLQGISDLAKQKIANIQSGATGGGVVNGGTNSSGGSIFNF